MSTSAIEQFIKKYQTAKNYNSKEIRFTISEAEDLSIALSLLLTKNESLSSKIIELQDSLLNINSDIDMSGGTFR